MARRRLRCRLEESAASFGYLPEAFTLDELRNLHEVFRGEALDPRQFRSWALAVGTGRGGRRIPNGGPTPVAAVSGEGPAVPVRVAR